MKLWKAIPVVAVLTAMVVAPKHFEPREAAIVAPADKTLELASLKLERRGGQDAILASRSPISANAPIQRPLDGIRICVDPGHGGQAQWDKLYYCGGTLGAATRQTESDVNLRVALCLRQYLEAAGADVVMTRISDDRCTNGGDKKAELDFRSGLANSRNCDLFISVHHNESTDRDSNYTAVFFPKNMASSVPLAENIASAVSKYLGTSNIGAKPGDYRVLKYIKMPGVICEASFMSNYTEDQRLQQLSYNKMEAKAIATGVVNYIRMSKGRQADFSTIFAPIDDQSHSAQMMADATFVRKQIVERRSLFGVKYEEISYDATGNITDRREIGNSRPSLAMAAKSVRNTVSKSVEKVVKVSKVSKVTIAASASKSKPTVVASSKSTSAKSGGATKRVKKITIN